MTATAGAARRPVRLLLRWLARAVGLAFAVAVVGALAVIVVIPRATQGSAMTVLSGSMTPGIRVGSVVVVRPVDPGTLEVGDVATYQKEPGKDIYVTHRIVKVDASASPMQFTFKGDANRGPDLEPVGPKQIRGEVWFHVPYLGSIRDGLHGGGGVTLVAMLVLAGYALTQVGAGLRERKQEEPGATLELPLDKYLVVATLDITRLHSLLPAPSTAETATRLGGLLVHEDDATCTLVLTSTADQLDERLATLTELQPRRLLVLDGDLTITGQVTRPATTAAEDARVEA